MYISNDIHTEFCYYRRAAHEQRCMRDKRINAKEKKIIVALIVLCIEKECIVNN